MSAKPLIVFVSVVVVIVSTAVVAYVLSRRGGIVRTHATWAAAAVWILIAFVATVRTTCFGRFSDTRGLRYKQLALDSIVLGAICFPLWFIAVRRTFQRLTKAKSSPANSISSYHV